MNIQFQLFYSFLKTGLLGYGGGPSAIPLVHKEVVEEYKWMTNDEFGDVLALANTLPGPINTKMAGYIGYRIGGVLGMLNAVLSSALPTIILMIVLLTSLSSFKDLHWVQGMTRAVVPVAGVMLATLTWQFFEQAKKGMGSLRVIIFMVANIILLEFLHIHPGVLIGVLLVAALVKGDKKEEGGSST